MQSKNASSFSTSTSSSSYFTRPEVSARLTFGLDRYKKTTKKNKMSVWIQANMYRRSWVHNRRGLFKSATTTTMTQLTMALPHNSLVQYWVNFFRSQLCHCNCVAGFCCCFVVVVECYYVNIYKSAYAQYPEATYSHIIWLCALILWLVVICFMQKGLLVPLKDHDHPPIYMYTLRRSLVAISNWVFRLFLYILSIENVPSKEDMHAHGQARYGTKRIYFLCSLHSHWRMNRADVINFCSLHRRHAHINILICSSTLKMNCREPSMDEKEKNCRREGVHLCSDVKGDHGVA